MTLLPQALDFNAMLRLAYPARYQGTGIGYNGAVSDVLSPIGFGGIGRTIDGGQSGSTVFIEGGNANDVAGGSGAEAIYLEGIGQLAADPAGAASRTLLERVATAGTSDSAPTTARFTYVTRWWVVQPSVSETKFNAGNMEIRFSASSAVPMQQIGAGRNISEVAMVAMQPHSIGFITRVQIRVPPSSPSLVELVVLRGNFFGNYPARIKTWNDIGIGETIDHVFDAPVRVRGQDFLSRAGICWVEAQAPAAATAAIEVCVSMTSIEQKVFQDALP